MQRQRLDRELSKIARSPPTGISVTTQENNRDKLDVCITGPVDSPYTGGVYSLEVVIGDKYPFAPPSIRFLTRIYHPNIDDAGRICLDLLKMPPNGAWKPTMSIEGVLIAVRMLMANPNPDDPLMEDIAQEFIADRKGYEQNARLHCEKYAKRDTHN